MDWIAIHFLLGHGIKLFEFRTLPVAQVGQITEFSASEISQTLLFDCPVRRCVE
jgi:hypothetical protein